MPITTRYGLLEEWYNKMYLLRCAFSGETPLSPIPLPDVTTVDGLLEGIANEADGSLIAVAKNAGVYHDYDEAYILQLPGKLYRWYGVKKVGGRTVIWNQLCDLGDVTSSARRAFKSGTSIVENHVYYASAKYTGSSNSLAIYARIGGSNVSVCTLPHSTPEKIFTSSYSATSDGTTYNNDKNMWFNGTGTWSSGDSATNIMLIDLTTLFGAGNEPATISDFKSKFPAEYYAFNKGELLSAGVTEIVSKDSNNTEVDTLVVPAGIQVLAGYGLSCPNNINYIDFEEKKFVQSVGSRTYEAGDESDATVITDGTTTNYPLDDLVETDISEYLTDVDLKVEAGGTLTFKNQNGDDYGIPVPSEVDYVGV